MLGLVIDVLFNYHMVVPRVHNVSSWQASSQALVRKTSIDNETVAASYVGHIVVNKTGFPIRLSTYFTVWAISFLQFVENYWGVISRIWGIIGQSSGNNWLVSREYRHRIIGYNTEHDVLRPLGGAEWRWVLWRLSVNDLFVYLSCWERVHEREWVCLFSCAWISKPSWKQFLYLRTVQGSPLKVVYHS